MILIQSRLTRFACAALFILVMTTGCTTQTNILNRNNAQGGRLLLWHTWTGPEAHILHEMLENYMEIYPEVSIISMAFDEDAVVSAFAAQSDGGLGPDLLLVDAATVYELATAGLIQDLAQHNDIDFSRYLSTALSMVVDGEKVYSLPFAVHASVLFYNQTLIDTPPDDVWDLLEQARRGETVAFNTSFAGSYWGIGAYDGGTIDDGELVLGLGGFANYLSALQMVRSIPNFILDDDAEKLRRAFINGEAAYYIGDSSELVNLQLAMDDEALGVAILPYGPNGTAAQPLLSLDAFVFSKVSRAGEMEMALSVADFLTSPQQQIDLATADIGRVPANNQVRVTPGMPERTIIVGRQAVAAEPIIFGDRQLWNELNGGALGFTDDFQQVVEGILGPNQMVDRSLAALSEAYGLPIKTIEPSDLCPAQPAPITVWHALPEDEAQAFADIAQRFEDVCSGVDVAVETISSSEIYTRYADAAGDGGGPDLLFGTSRSLPRLADQGLIKNIGERIAPATLQRFMPTAVQTMRYNERLYGIPESIVVLALYYNVAQVADPPTDLESLTQKVSTELRWALPVGFFQGYWGLLPFGGFTFDSQSNAVRDTTGLVGWLTWLQSVDPRPGVDLTFDPTVAEQAFANAEAAYLVSGPGSLSLFRRALGDDGFSVVLLPNGPSAVGSPMLEIYGSMINANTSEAATEVAIALALYLNLAESQQRFLETGSHVSASVTIDLQEYPHIDTFREQAKVARRVVENAAYARMEAFGDELYRAVLLDGADPAQAVAEFVTAVERRQQSAESEETE